MRYNGEHVPFNSAFFYVLSLSFPKERISFYAQKRHLLAVRDKLDSNEIKLEYFEFKEIRGVSNKKGTASIFWSYLFCLVQDIFQLLLTKSHDIVFFTSTNPISLPFVKLLNKILRRKVFIVLHGELEYLNDENDKLHGSIKKYIRIWYRLVFWRFLNDKTKYIVLGGSIFNNLKQIHPNLTRDSFIILDHPYFYPGIKNVPIVDKKRTVVYGTVGYAACIKGSDKIFTLAKLLEDKILNQDIELTIVGQTSACLTEFKNNLVNTFDSSSFIPSDVYNKAVEDLDYVLFFYPDDLYRFIASGAFFDAIAFEKPIISLRNCYFEYYFDLLGDIGYLCDNLDEMVQIINNFDVERYRKQRRNIRNAKETLSITQIAENLSSQIIV